MVLRHNVRVIIVIHENVVLVGAGDVANVEYAAAPRAPLNKREGSRHHNQSGASLEDKIDVVRHFVITANRKGNVGVDVQRNSAADGRPVFVAVDRSPRIDGAAAEAELERAVHRLWQSVDTKLNKILRNMRQIIRKIRRNDNLRIPRVLPAIVRTHALRRDARPARLPGVHVQLKVAEAQRGQQLLHRRGCDFDVYVGPKAAEMIALLHQQPVVPHRYSNKQIISRARDEVVPPIVPLGGKGCDFFKHCRGTLAEVGTRDGDYAIVNLE